MNENANIVRKKKKNHREIYLVLLLLLFISVGFSYLTTQLDILGNTTVRKQSWNIHFDSLTEASGNVPGTSRAIADRGEATITSDKTTEVKFTANLEYPGDYYEFTVAVKNAGTIDAMIADSGIVDTISPEKSFIKYSVTYADATTDPLKEIKVKDGLHNGKNILVKVRVEYDKDAVTNDDVNNMDAGGIVLTSTYSMKFIQADNTASYKTFEITNS